MIENEYFIIENGVLTGVTEEAKKLEELVIPEGVTEIGEEAFYDASIEKIVIPETVTSIGDRAFKGCKSLKSIVIPGGDESKYKYGSFSGIQHVGSRIFDQCCSLETVTIHCGSGCWLTPDMFGRNNNSLRSVKITHYSFKGMYSFEDKENEYVISIPKAELVDGSSSPRSSKICNLFTEMCINLGKYMNKRDE